MGTTTKISWCDSTISPWIGCAQCSPGCDHCYAKGIANRFYKDVKWGPEPSGWRDVASFFQRAMALERKAVRLGRSLFVFPSMCDPFFSPYYWEADEWAETAVRTPHLVWLLLTKRPEAIPDREWPRNVWLGVSAENQECADRRVPELLKKRCSVRFVSVEPMLGPVELGRRGESGYLLDKFGLDWVICGGESGAGARRMEMPWAQRLRASCMDSGVPFWFKQYGSAWGRKLAHCDQLWGKAQRERPEPLA